ncbi:MAG: peptidoglycan-binding protein [Patescibacteria group bacterium]
MAFAETRSIVFPVGGEFRFRDDYGEPRGDGTRAHQGIDIIAGKMTPVVATVDGVITFIAAPEASWGYSITIRDADNYSYRYLHMNNDTPGTDDGAGGEQHAYAPGLTRGSRVSRGQVIGWVGDSGNAESTVAHLHFEIRGPDGLINPYDSLYAAAGGTGMGAFAVPRISGTEGSIEEEEAFIIRRQLQEGMYDRDVLGLNQELKTLGFLTGNVTEVYTAETREAVRRFQVSKKLLPTGIADAETRKKVSEAMKLPIPVPVSPTSSSSGLSLGTSGETVRIVQAKLKELGFLAVKPTGYFGPLTEAAVIAFQKANGIDPIGVVGPKTRAALDAVKAAPETESGTTLAFVFQNNLEEGMRSDEVRELQLVLAARGHFAYEPTGYFGPLTEAAVVAFQTANGIEPAGIVGPKTRAALNTSQ